MSNNSHLVHKRVRAMRETKNLNHEYMAAKLGISQNAYSKVELGNTAITVERLFALAEILETTAVDLISVES